MKKFENQFLRLPSCSTLYWSTMDFKHEPGFHAHVLEDMCKQVKIETVQDHQKYVALILDELNIKEYIVYSKHTGKILGLANLSKTGNQVEDLLAKIEGHSNDYKTATNMLTLFVRGLTSTFKHSFAHFPTYSTSAQSLHAIAWEAIEKLES